MFDGDGKNYFGYPMTRKKKLLETFLQKKKKINKCEAARKV